MALPVSAARRAAIGEAASEVLEGRVKFMDFYSGLSEDDLEDPLVEELVDLLEHQPTIGRFFGVSAEELARYIADMRQIAETLRGAK